jgi:hypothetical protein
MYIPSNIGWSSFASRILGLLYKDEIVFVFVCMFAYESRANQPTCTNLGKLIP